MFSPDLVRFIIDPDKVTENCEENRKVFVEKEIFRFSILDHEKVLSDYSFFHRVLYSFCKVCNTISSQSKQFKECEVTETEI